MKKRVLCLFFLIVIFAACFAIPFQASATSSIRILYKCNITNPTSNTLGPWFKVYNDGPDALTLSEVTIRYWYSRDTLAKQLSFCDWAQVGTSNVTHQCLPKNNPPNGANYYLEVGFTAGAGTIASGSNSGEIQLRVCNELWNNYDQATDYSFNGAMTSFQQNTKVTAYINGNLVYGTEPTPATGKKFLVIVSKPLYDTGLITSALNTYQNDLTAAGWTPLMITVDSDSATNPQYFCPDPPALKAVIQNYYNQNYIGFVLIGSQPAIPTAFWRYSLYETLTEREAKYPTDLFYADMDEWDDVDGDTAYETYNSTVRPPIGDSLGIYFAPEMIWGRISARYSISTTTIEEANRVAAYLAKVHNYRVNGSSLTPAQQERMLAFYDNDDYKGGRGHLDWFRNGSRKINGFFDNSITTPEKLKAELENGYQFASYSTHSDPDIHYMQTFSSEVVYNLDYINTMTPRVHYINMFACSPCRYQEPGDLNYVANIGAAYLFHPNGLVLNVTGSTGAWGLVPQGSYWQAIHDGKSIGEALRDYFAWWITYQGEEGCPKGVLLGDPTITYNVPAFTNKMPWITTNLEGPVGKKCLEVVPDVAFDIDAFDEGTESVSVVVTGLPAWSETYANPRKFTWIPKTSDLFKVYQLTATATDTAGNEYVEKFSVRVVPYPDVKILNYDFQKIENGLPLNWATHTDSGNPAFAGVEVTGKGNMGQISATSLSQGHYAYSVNVVPNTDYVLSGFIKTENVSGGTGAQLRIDGISGAFTQSMSGTGEGSTAVKFNSGSNTSVEIQCSLGSTGNSSTGSVWFDNVKLESLGNNPASNLGFENDIGGQPDNWDKQIWKTGSSLAIDGIVKRSGTYSIKINSPTVGNDARFIQLVDLKPNTHYQLRGYVRTENVPVGVGARLLIQCSDGSTGVSGSCYGTDPPGTWHEVVCDFWTTFHCKAQLQCRLGYDWTPVTGAAWFDDLTLTEIP
ncbi:MAG TPA: cellulose binding domain-containing protein [Bacillota bacterium]|nr:cellulose binding domain-containing protein [Bacillota bacterium]